MVTNYKRINVVTGRELMKEKVMRLSTESYDGL